VCIIIRTRAGIFTLDGLIVYLVVFVCTVARPVIITRSFRGSEVGHHHHHHHAKMLLSSTTFKVRTLIFSMALLNAHRSSEDARNMSSQCRNFGTCVSSTNSIEGRPSSGVEKERCTVDRRGLYTPHSSELQLPAINNPRHRPTISQYLPPNPSSLYFEYIIITIAIIPISGFRADLIYTENRAFLRLAATSHKTSRIAISLSWHICQRISNI
jgi:hypothetical protein